MAGAGVILGLEEKAGAMLSNPAFVWSDHTPAVDEQPRNLLSKSEQWLELRVWSGTGSSRYQLHEYVLGHSSYSGPVSPDSQQEA